MNAVSLIGKEWNDLIGDEFTKQYMVNLGHIIRDDRMDYTIYPEDASGVFQVFRNLSPSNIRCVVVGQD